MSKTVGRGRQADVTVDDPSLSRVHARIAVDLDGQISIDDLGSTNGIFVNGAEQLSSYLMLGDIVRFGRVEYIVSNGDETGPIKAEGPIASQTILRRVAMSATPKVDRLVLEALLATSREMMAFEDLPALLERVLDRLSVIVKSDRAAILRGRCRNRRDDSQPSAPRRVLIGVRFASSTVCTGLTARDVFIGS